METYELAFPGCSVHWNRESLNLLLVSSRTFLGAGNCWDWRSARSDLNPGAIFVQFSSQHLLEGERSDPSEHREACREGFSIPCLRHPTNGCNWLNLGLPGYTLNITLNSKARYIHVFVLTYDEGMRSPSSRQSKCAKVWSLQYIFIKFNSCYLCGILQQRKSGLWLTVYTHPVDFSICLKILTSSFLLDLLLHFLL